MSYTYEYPRPAVTVDGVVFYLHDNDLNLLLIKRKHPPFDGSWALPGGFIDMDEAPEESVVREVKEETGLDIEAIVQVGAFGAVDRDPRHRTISIVYASILKGNRPDVKGADDAADAKWFSIKELPTNLAFDHHDIIEQAKVQLDAHLRVAVPSSEEAFDLSEQELKKVLDLIA